MANFSSKLNKDFGSYIISVYVLEEAVDWINLNLDPEEVFDRDKLGHWALRNSFTQKED